MDLDRVAFLDSSGLAALVAALKAMEVVDGSLALLCGHEQILKVFTVTGLDRVFRIRGSIQEAIAP